MKKLLTMAAAIFILLTGVCQASIESKSWPASDKAQAFVKETVVIGFFASPWGTGWTENKHLHDYLDRAKANVLHVSIC